MTGRIFGALAAISLSVLASSNPVGATVLIQAGAGNFANDSNVVFNPCPGTVSGPGLTVTGCLNNNNSYLVDFTGLENLVVNGGQALVADADSNGFNSLSVSAQLGGFATFITDINATSDGNNGQPNNGQVQITPYIGALAQTAQIFNIGESGSNFFRISTDNGDLFSKITFFVLNFATTNIRFEDFRQNRLGPAPGVTAQVAEPVTLVLFVAGLAGLAFAGRRRRRLD